MTLLTKLLNEKIDQRTTFADNLLKVLKVAISSSAALRPITAGEDLEAPGRVRLTFKTENAWAYWASLIGESPFAPDPAIRVQVNGEWQHRWMSSDAGIVCIYIEARVPDSTDNSPYDPRD